MPKVKKQKKQRSGPSLDAVFLTLVLVLLSFGLVMLFSASYAYAYYRFQNSLYFITRQALFAVAGVVLMLVLSRLDYHVLQNQKVCWGIYLLTVVLLVVVLFMRPLNGARRWIILPFTTFQPSELAKFAIVVMFACLIEKNHKKMHTFRYGVAPFMTLAAVVCGLMLLEPHLSGIILILSISMWMLYVGGMNRKLFAAVMILVVGGLALVLFTDIVPYASTRVELWRDPWSDPVGDGFQTVQSLLAIGSGGLFGVGLGQSRQKYMYIPEPHNDFIFSVACEELGFIGATVIILLFIALVVRGFVIALKAKDKFGMLLAVGLTAQVGLQALLNIAVVTNTIPNTGISLPFFSYGGTSLLMLLAEMGIVLSVSRYSKNKSDE